MNIFLVIYYILTSLTITFYLTSHVSISYNNTYMTFISLGVFITTSMSMFLLKFLIK